MARNISTHWILQLVEEIFGAILDIPNIILFVIDRYITGYSALDFNYGYK